jgi:hypothetical protein
MKVSAAEIGPRVRVNAGEPKALIAQVMRAGRKIHGNVNQGHFQDQARQLTP